VASPSPTRILAVPLVYTYTGYLDSATEYEFLVKVFLLFLKRFLLLYLLLLVQLFSQSNGSTVGGIDRNTVILEGDFPTPFVHASAGHDSSLLKSLVDFTS
jgi:hypothetical protein